MSKKDNIHWQDDADDADAMDASGDSAPQPPPPPGRAGDADSDPGAGRDAGDNDESIEQAERTVSDDFADLLRRIAELEKKLVRANADYQNVVRRSEQNVINAREYAIMELAKELLTVLDHFDHALMVDPENVDPKSLLNGMQIVRDELIRTLHRYGVKRLDIEPGQEFDPQRHEAMMRQPADDMESNSIVSELQPGYSIGDKLLRAAKVSVAE